LNSIGPLEIGAAGSRMGWPRFLNSIVTTCQERIQKAIAGRGFLAHYKSAEGGRMKTGKNQLENGGRDWD